MRSSWETSETKVCCIEDSCSSCVIWVWMESAMRLKERLSCATSLVPRTCMRTSRSPSDSRWDTRAVLDTGRTTSRVTYQTMVPTSSSSATMDSSSTAWIESSVACGSEKSYTKYSP